MPSTSPPARWRWRGATWRRIGWLTGPEAIVTLGETLRDAGLTASNEVYDGAAHGYSMSDTSMYDEAATERHFAELRELLDRTLH